MIYKASLAALLMAAPAFAFADQAIAGLKPETQVTISGTVERIADEDTFILSDESGQIEVYLGPNLVPVPAGTAVTVTGIVDDGPIPEIYASSLQTADGQIFTFDRSYD